MTTPNIPQGEPGDYAGAMLAAVFSKVSQTISGPNRLVFDPDQQAQELVDIESLDPDYWATDDLGDPYDFGPFMDGMLAGLPPTQLTDPNFNLDSLPAPGQGQFYKTPKGLLRYSIGVGEAPDNKANTNHPAFQARAHFMAKAYDFVQQNFDATPAGQHRAHDAPVTAQRSSNSDHYSGGAFDVRASNPQEAQRILTWASQQPWISFAQVYPDGHLVHISANIAAFPAGVGMPNIVPTKAPLPGTSGILPGSSPQPSPAPASRPPKPVIHAGTGGPQA
jgi:hypothetical protein